MMRNVELMLGQFIVHADLAAHNILYCGGQPWIIDLPQAVPADRHPAAQQLLSRDIDRVCQYFRKQGVKCDGGQIAAEMWGRFVRQDL